MSRSANLHFLEVERSGDLKIGRCCGFATVGRLAALLADVCFLEARLLISSIEVTL